MKKSKEKKGSEKQEKNQDENLDDLKKDIICYMVCFTYLQYCKEEDKKTIFLYNNSTITPKEALKVIKNRQFKTEEEYSKHQKFVEHIAIIANKDDEYNKWYEDSITRCEKCGYSPMKEDKCSKYHKEWINVQEYNHKESKEFYNDDEFNCVFRRKCPMCNYEYFYSTGIDTEPEIGLRS